MHGRKRYTKRNKRRIGKRRRTIRQKGGDYNQNTIERTLADIKQLRAKTAVILDHATYISSKEKFISIGDEINTLLKPFTTGTYLNYSSGNDDPLYVQRARLNGLKDYVFGSKEMRNNSTNDMYDRPEYDIEVEKFIEGYSHTKYKNEYLENLLKENGNDKSIHEIIADSKKIFMTMLNLITSLYFEVKSEEKQQASLNDRRKTQQIV